MRVPETALLGEMQPTAACCMGWQWRRPHEASYRIEATEFREMAHGVSGRSGFLEDPPVWRNVGHRCVERQVSIARQVASEDPVALCDMTHPRVTQVTFASS